MKFPQPFYILQSEQVTRKTYCLVTIMFTEMNGCKNNKICFSLGPISCQISNFQIDLQPTFNIWECLYQSIAIRNIPASVQNFIFIVCLYWTTFNEVFWILSKTPSNIFQRKNWGWKCCQQAKKKFHWSSKMTTLEHHEFCLCVFILAISRELKRRNSWKYSTSAR